MKELHAVIRAWVNKSGVHYDNVNGADIKDTESGKVFSEWVSQKVVLIICNLVMVANSFG